MARFPIAYTKLMRTLMVPLGLGPRRAWIEVGGEDVEVHMGWAFRARFPRTAVSSAARSDQRSISQGVHGRNGRWRVNGTTRGVVLISVSPEQTARALGRVVRLSTLEVSPEDPNALLAALRPPPG
jgi:hypothetical protein